MNINRYDITERFAEMWKQSRHDAGKSQDYMARELGVSKKTIQNWEAGTASPSQEKGFEWFSILGLQPLPYYLRFLYPVFHDISAESPDEQITEALVTLIRTLSPSAQRKLLYFCYGSYGSSPQAVLELMTAHLHTPMRDRINVAQSVLTNYEIAQARNELIKPEHIQPNTDLLKKSIERAKNSVIEGKNSYMTIV